VSASVHDVFRFGGIIAVAAGTYLYLLLLGWGLTRLLFRQRAVPYQLWLAPWFGLMLAVIPMLWLNRLGISAGRSFHVITLLGTLLVVLCLLKRVPLFVPTDAFDAWLAAGAFATLAIALYPMLSVANAPTTISLGNNDPALYAVATDFLKSHSVADLPPPNPRLPSANLLGYMLSPGHRPGAFLVLLLFDWLFHAPTYRVFSIVLAVLLALTTPLIAIFTDLIAGKRSCAMIALSLSAANVNFLYCYYQGFAAQVLIQGCIIATFILVLVDEQENPGPLSYSIAVGLAIVTMIVLVPEGAAFFLLPYLLYVALQVVFGAHSQRELLERYGPVAAVVVLAGLFPLWEGVLWVRHIATLQFGWNIPNWALPIHMIGLMSAVDLWPRSIFVMVALSIPVIGAIGWGIRQSRNRLLMTALTVFNVGVLLYFGPVRHYSYAYYKAAVMAGFVFIAAFSAGLPALLYRYQAAVCATLAIVTLIVCRPTIVNIWHYPFEVTRELSGLGEIPSALRRGAIISLDQLSLWDRLWAIDFMPDAALTAPDPFFSERTPAALAPVYRSFQDRKQALSKDTKVLWTNDRYELITTGRSR
jgi:hypothetical protein